MTYATTGACLARYIHVLSVSGYSHTYAYARQFSKCDAFCHLHMLAVQSLKTLILCEQAKCTQSAANGAPKVRSLCRSDGQALFGSPVGVLADDLLSQLAFSEKLSHC